MPSEATRAKELALLPCPFCGWSVTADEGLCKWDKDEFGDTVDEITYTGVCCPGCSASVPINAKTAAEAIAAWNKRPPADALASIRAERDMAERAAVEAAIPLEALLMAGQGPLSDAVWDGVRNGVGHVRSMLKARAARAIAGEQKND